MGDFLLSYSISTKKINTEQVFPKLTAIAKGIVCTLVHIITVCTVFVILFRFVHVCAMYLCVCVRTCTCVCLGGEPWCSSDAGRSQWAAPTGAAWSRMAGRLGETS